MTVNIGSGDGTSPGDTTVGTNIVGTLKFGSATAANVTTFQNAINLNGANRTIQVDDDIRLRPPTMRGSPASSPTAPARPGS